ncbi:MAG: T9SS type A sorting domain-containing protein [candidate division KSB1 bacterium]|nr:T9SS type A sorting domain-containing protein [candidate division KSB1 bacterium]MDZ7364691.1 T9SS type A sorting domain-containing protein [candidate division KSB1 bacterium]MDZ7402561.1 T9SS type A sorting domain-containing protein [candidate division KSB1 bacterium]
MSYRYKIYGRAVSLLPIVAVMILFFSSFSFAQISANRPYQPVIVKGSSFAEFSNNAAPIGQLFLYKYITASKAWEQIPFQFDEVEPDPSPTDPNRTTYFGTGDGNLDDQDELSFMARDAGDKAPTNAWIDNASSLSFARYEIEITDPLLTSGNTGYVYLFRSGTLSTPPAAKDYVTYIKAPANASAGQDTVRGQSYEEGHAGNGIQDWLRVPVAANGSNLDFMDRLKVRFKVFAILAEVTFTEAGLSLQGVRVRDGRVRVIRELQERISLITGNLDFPILIFYYGYSSVLGTSLNLNALPSGVRVLSLRQSFDFDPRVNGAKWFNQNLATPVNVTGSSGNLNAAQSAVVYEPNLNWYMLSSAHGSFVNLFSVPPNFGSNQRFYFHDAQSGTNDGTDDTGDNKSYGDGGLLITGNDIKGVFNLLLISYVLGKDQPRTAAEALYNQTTKPLTFKTQAQRNTVAVQQPTLSVPLQFALLQNSPNPLSLSTPATAIRYELPHTTPTPVTLRIFNLLGQKVRELVNAVQPAGRYEAQWDGRMENGERAPAGIYFYQLRAGNQTATRKLMVLL